MCSDKDAMNILGIQAQQQHVAGTAVWTESMQAGGLSLVKKLEWHCSVEKLSCSKGNTLMPGSDGLTNYFLVSYLVKCDTI